MEEAIMPSQRITSTAYLGVIQFEQKMVLRWDNGVDTYRHKTIPPAKLRVQDCEISLAKGTRRTAQGKYEQSNISTSEMPVPVPP